MSDSELHLACSADRRYVSHCAAMIHSALRNGGVDLHVHFLHGPRMSAAVRERLKRMVDELGGVIAFHEVEDARVAGLPIGKLWSATIWYRIFLPDILPSLDRILYVDADTLVVSSLAPLLDVDLTGHYVGAVTNVPERHRMGHAEEIGLAGPGDYFNSGVLLMNLAEMRRTGVSETLAAFAREHGEELLWPDQDALNVVLGPGRLRLDPRWNRMNSLDFGWSEELLSAEEIAGARADPAILHFEGPSENKPWHVLATPERRRRYDEHRRHTPWPRYRPAGLTPANVVRRLAGARRSP